MKYKISNIKLTTNNIKFPKKNINTYSSLFIYC